MRQSILNAGDLVRYHIENPELTAMGFKLGQFYPVSQSGSRLSVDLDLDGAYLTYANGELTDYADNFTKHGCPVTLPIGQLQKRGL